MRTAKIGTNHQILSKEFKIHRNLTGIFWQTRFFKSFIFEPVVVQRHNIPHFKGLIKLYLDKDSSRAWQHFYLPPRP